MLWAKPRRPIGWIITVILLFLALGATVYVLLTALQQLKDAQTVIDRQNDLIQEKQTFDSAMQDLVDTAGRFDGAVFGTLVPQDKLYILAARGWKDRWNGDAVAKDTEDVRAATADLDAELTAAADQAATNVSGSKYEAVLDKLGGGFVTTAIDNADSLCQDDVLGCVTSADPYTVHIDKADTKVPYMTDLIRAGISYHEFAHVLQYTNPDATEVPAEAFDGNYETMADCFALTYLKGWKLHHTVFVSQFEYYEVDVGYGYTCNSKQRAVIKDWYEGLAYKSLPITQ